MKINWLRTATLATAVSAGLPLAAHAQSPDYHLSDAQSSDAVVDPSAMSRSKISLSDIGEEIVFPATNLSTSQVPSSHSRANYNGSGYSATALASHSLLSEGCQADCAADAACDASTSCGCDDCCDSCGCGCLDWLNCWPCGCALSDLGDACLLADHFCCFKERGGVIGGWLAQSYVWNPYQPEDRFNGPMTWTDRANDYQMNEVYFYAGRAANTEGCGFDWGWRVDSIYGTNYRWNTSGGFETNFGNGQFYGWAIPQVYAETAYNDLSIKWGRFYSPVGYYVVGQANNFFPVLPYTFQYGEPFTHTGALATYKLSDSLTVGGGITHGWDASDNTANPHAGGLATATWTIDDQRSLAYVGVFGPEPNFSGVNPANTSLGIVGYTTRYLQTLAYIRKFSDDITGVIQSDFGWQKDALFNPNQELVDAKWYGVNAYLYWNQTCRLQWGLNAEWFRDQGGYRVGSLFPSFGSPNASGLGSDQSTGNFFTRTGYDGSFYRVMFGPKYYFTPNIYGRAAFAADWYDGKTNNPGNLEPFDNGLRDHQEAVVFDLIATF